MTAKLRVLLLGALVWAAANLDRPACAAGLSRLTLVVVPDRYSVLQVAFDLERRCPVVLVSYAGNASTEVPRLNAWNGHQWMPVTLEDYREGGFLQARPERAVLIGDEKLLPPALASVEGWCPRVSRVPSIDTSAMLNSLGKLLNFRASDWKWFAARYNLDLRDVNEKRRQESWYDRPSWTDKPRPTPAPPTLKPATAPPSTTETPVLTVTPAAEPAKPAEPAPAVLPAAEPAKPVEPAAPAAAPAAEPAKPAEPAAPAPAPIVEPAATNAPAGPPVK